MTAFGTLINSNVSEINSNVSDDILDSKLIRMAGVPPVEWYETWGGIESEHAEGIALDSSGNAYLAGGTGSFGALGWGDWCLVNFNSNGHFNWSSQWGGDGYEQAEGIALDSSGNAYVVGFSNSDGDAEQMCLVKFNSTGDVKWKSIWGGIDGECGIAIALNSSGYAYVAGDTTSYGDGVQMCLVKFNTTTGIAEDFSVWGGSGYDDGYAIALDSSGNAYVAGVTDNNGAGNKDMCLVKFNSTGDYQWNSTWGGSGDEDGVSMVLDKSGNVLVTGRTESFGAGNKDMCLVKFNSTGGVEWNTTWGGSGDDKGSAIALDKSGNVLVAGGTNSYGAGNEDMCLVKFNPSGAVEWNTTWGGSENDRGCAIALDSSGNALVAGGTNSYGMGNEDMCLVKFTIDTGSPIVYVSDDDDDDDDGNEMDPIVIYTIAGVISGAGVVTVASIIHFKRRRVNRIESPTEPEAEKIKRKKISTLSHSRDNYNE